jgi:hypothetical protein
MLVGLVGLVVPVFPGLIVMWLAALGYGVLTGFSPLGIFLFVVITLLMLAGSVIDNLMLGVGARQGGASWRTIAVALLGGVIGTLVFPPFGGIIAAPVAVLLLEYWRVRDWQKAWRSLRGMATGWGLSYFIRLFFGIFLLVLWLLWVWKG